MSTLENQIRQIVRDEIAQYEKTLPKRIRMVLEEEFTRAFGRKVPSGTRKESEQVEPEANEPASAAPQTLLDGRLAVDEKGNPLNKYQISAFNRHIRKRQAEEAAKVKIEEIIHEATPPEASKAVTNGKGMLAGLTTV